MSDDFAQTLPAPLRALVEAEYPRFSAAEMARRRASVEALLAEQEPRPPGVLRPQPRRLGGAVDHPMAGDHRGGRRALARHARCHVRAIRQPCAAGATVCRHGRAGGMGRRVLDPPRRGDSRAARGAGGPHRRDRPDDVRATRRALRALRQGRKPQPRLHAAAPGQVGRGARLVSHRRGVERPRHGGPARRRAPGPRRARAR